MFNNKIMGLLETLKINKQQGKVNDPIKEWENLKQKIKTVAITRSSEIKKDDNSRKRALQNNIIQLHQKIDNRMGGIKKRMKKA